MSKKKFVRVIIPAEVCITIAVEENEDVIAKVNQGLAVDSEFPILSISGKIKARAGLQGYNLTIWPKAMQQGDLFDEVEDPSPKAPFMVSEMVAILPNDML